jgi:hypothetical protein
MLGDGGGFQGIHAAVGISLRRASSMSVSVQP